MRKQIFAALLAALLLLPAAALGSDYDAQIMENWLARFCEALASLPLMGDPQDTADPARPGEYLLEYEFGTVTALSDGTPAPQDILEIAVRTAQVTDCMGIRVGMTLDEVLQGRALGKSSTQLYVLETQEAGLGFSWAYMGESGVYGVERITYGTQGTLVREYTLTYVIDNRGVVSAIRVRCADSTQAQAQQAMDTAEEIAQRQRGEVYAVANAMPAMAYQDLQVMGVAALGLQVADLIDRLGEPVEVQSVAGSQGRLLLYEGATVELRFNVQTGEEVVCGVSASASDVSGPNRLMVGMSVQEAAACFRCDEDVYAVGGSLYRADENSYGELVRGDLGTEAVLRYAAADSANRLGVLEIGIQDGMVRHWYFYDVQEER